MNNLSMMKKKMPAFRKFPNLPTDVRKRIWIFASIKPHTYVILWYPSEDSIARQYTLLWPGVLAGQSRRCEYGLLLANKESSEVVSQINKDTKPVSGLVHNLDLFINWDLDLLYVAAAPFDPTPAYSKNDSLRHIPSYAKYWTPLDAEPVGYNCRELRTLASNLPRDTHGFTNLRLLGPSLTSGIIPLLGTQFTEWSELNNYCRKVCEMIHHLRYKKNQAAWGTLNVCLAVDLDSNFNRGDFPDEYRRVGIRRSSREWYIAPERPMIRR
ncbi:hypothetical protein PG997_006433 [Apiospora hydei]|uniref:2EXR domain-containing protein n=1 Tax=Apiospora hydei TaxID=1337664 RepID=A0ABR1WQ71_9PEZI